MKKILALSILSFLLSTFAFAEGFKDTSDKKVTIAQALKMSDDMQVTLQGNLIKKISDDKYTFKDPTGTITVEIDKDKWAGLSAETKDKLEITGEIEKKFNVTYVDVDSIRKAK